MNKELNEVQEAVRAKENEKEQIRRNLMAESRQLAAVRAEMDQLRDRFKSQENNHVTTVAELKKAHQDEVSALKAEVKTVQRGVPSGAEDALSPSQQIAFQQVCGSMLVIFPYFKSSRKQQAVFNRSLWDTYFYPPSHL